MKEMVKFIDNHSREKVVGRGVLQVEGTAGREVWRHELIMHI